MYLWFNTKLIHKVYTDNATECLIALSNTNCCMLLYDDDMSVCVVFIHCLIISSQKSALLKRKQMSYIILQRSLLVYISSVFTWL